MSFASEFNNTMRSFQDHVDRALYGDPSDEQMIAWAREHYGDGMAKALEHVLANAESTLTQAVRRSLVREMGS